MITARQIKAARAMLDWSREDLASVCGLSLSTIRNLEAGFISPRGSTTNAIRRVVEDKGLEFTDQEGIRRRNRGIEVFDGPNSCDALFDDMLRTVKKSQTDIYALSHSQDLLADICQLKGQPLVRLEELADICAVKCLLAEAFESSLLATAIEFRSTLKQHAGPVPYFIYGGSQALVSAEDKDELCFIVLRSPQIVRNFRDHFLAMWNAAPPITSGARRSDRRTRI